MAANQAVNWQSFNNEGTNSKYLFKFLPKKYLLEFLKTGDIWFSRADQFGDKMECVAIQDIGENKFDYEKIKERQKRNLISCFHEATKETLAFWDTYAKTDEDRRKYALRFNREELVNLIKKNTETISHSSAIRKLVHGKIVYKNLIGANTEKLKLMKVAHAAFRKEYVFSYEKEYRFNIQTKNRISKKGANLKIGHPADIEFAIYINPLLEDADYKNCKQAIIEKGFEFKLKQSSLEKWLKPNLYQL